MKKLIILFSFLLVLSLTPSLLAQSLNPLRGVVILLDPGHGGADPGAVGPTGLKESEVNLRVARYLKTLLEADGAKVQLTRTKDVYLSLKDRVQQAEKLIPDLFVSIHHNASLSPVKKNKSEVYYNAMDQGLSQKVSNSMITEFAERGLGDESVVIPGGFFVLRNNPSPAILTEGSYITIPKIEQELKTGKALTNQAQAIRKAIQKAFIKGPLKVKIFTPEKPVKINTPYFNFLFDSNKEIAKVKVRSKPEGMEAFIFTKIPSMGYTYSLYNQVPLTSGNYELELTFVAKDGSIAPRISVPISVNLPVAQSIIRSVAPFIPEGFMGRFPVKIALKDMLHKLNARNLPVTVRYGQESITATSSEKGETTVFLELSGNEKDSLEAELIVDGQIIGRTVIPINKPEKTFVLGRVLNHNNAGLANVKIRYGFNGKSTTDPDGFFYLEYPRMYHNLKLQVEPGLGYAKKEYWIRTEGEPVVLPLVRVTPVSERLLTTTIGIMAPMSFDNLVRKLVRDVMQAGAKVHRLHLPENDLKPEYQAVMEANLKENMDILFSFKRGLVNTITMRHYHRGGKGKRFADAVAFGLSGANPPIKIKVEAGSDYEINHTGSTAVVIILPQQLPPDYPEKLILHIAAVLKAGF